jgi:hypothetical protein
LVRRRDCLRVVGGLNAFKAVLELYLRKLYEYNTLARRYGVYLKPVHIVVRVVGAEKRTYYYVGRYWWRIEYAGKQGRTSRLRWKYIGREKPAELKDVLPDPPRNPLEGLKFYAIGDDVVVDRETYEKFSWVFAGRKVVEC